MLKKVNRLKSRKDFEEIKKAGVMYHSPSFSLIIKISELMDQSEPRFGFVVSKKISKKAVERNKVKRLLSTILQKRLNRFNKKTKGIILVKSCILEKKEAEISMEIDKILERVE